MFGVVRFFREFAPPLRLTAVFLFLGYLIFPLWFPLIPYFNHAPTRDIRSFAPSLAAGLAYGALLCWLFGWYMLAQRRLRRMPSPPRLRALALTAVFFAIPLLFTYPLTANDIFRYFMRGRVTAVYHENPFATALTDLPDDPYLPLAGEWAGETTPYGPVWEATAQAITAVAPNNLLVGLILFKALGLLLFVAMGWLIASSQQPRQKSFAALIWLWNPALPLIFVMDGHNDALMLFWLVLGFWLTRRNRPLAGMAVMFLSPLTKLIGALPLPFVFIGIWRELENGRARLKFLLSSGGIGLIMLAVSFLPFGSPLDLAQRLLREASAGAGFSLSAALILLAREWQLPVTFTLVGQAGMVLFLTAVFWLLWRGANGRSPLRGAADIFFAYLLTAMNYRLWYTAWPFPWLLLDDLESKRARSRLKAGLWLLFSTQLTVIIYGQLRVYWMGGSQLGAHLFGVLVVLGGTAVFFAKRG